MVGVDLFSGAGGLSAGAAAAGVDVVLAIESDSHAAATYGANHPDTELRVCDIRSLPDLPSLDAAEETVVFGGPPCQGFSTSNQRTRSLDNPVNHLYVHFIRQVRSMRPTHVVFENVKGFLETKDSVFFERVMEALDKLGYALAHDVLTATDYGIPQRRSRLFIVGSLGRQPTLPSPTTRAPPTVADALLDLPDVDNGAYIDEIPYSSDSHSEYSRLLRAGRKKCTNNLVTRNADYVVERYKHIPPGGNWRDIPERLMANYADRTRCHDGIYHRLSWDRPSIVIGNYRKNMLIHPSANRGLSVREAARIQSFPDSYRFTGSIGFQQQQVANAVPPMLAQAVFEQLAGESSTRGRTELMPSEPLRPQPHRRLPHRPQPQPNTE